MSTKEQRQKVARLESQIDALTGRTRFGPHDLKRSLPTRRNISLDKCTIIGHLSDDPETGAEIFTPNPDLEKPKPD